MRLKILSLLAAAALVSACASSTSGSGSAAGGSAISPGSQQDLSVNVGDRVHFGFDKYNLTAEARAVLQSQAAWLGTNEIVSLTIEGHADERGTREYNLALGERRANSVRDYLIVLGVPADRLSIVSFGKERPADPASNEAAWAKNRRAVATVN